jgi:hypothetical protein
MSTVKEIKVKTSDNQEFSVPEAVLFQSILIKNLYADLDVGDEALPLPNVTGHILTKGIYD